VEDRDFGSSREEYVWRSFDSIWVWNVSSDGGVGDWVAIVSAAVL